MWEIFFIFCTNQNVLGLSPLCSVNGYIRGYRSAESWSVLANFISDMSQTVVIWEEVNLVVKISPWDWDAGKHIEHFLNYGCISSRASCLCFDKKSHHGEQAGQKHHSMDSVLVSTSSFPCCLSSCPTFFNDKLWYGSISHIRHFFLNLLLGIVLPHSNSSPK